MWLGILMSLDFPTSSTGGVLNPAMRRLSEVIEGLELRELPL